MLMTEWNWDDAKQVWQEEAHEKGLQQGREEEREKVLSLLRQGLSLEEIEKRLQ